MVMAVVVEVVVKKGNGMTIDIMRTIDLNEMNIDEMKVMTGIKKNFSVYVKNKLTYMMRVACLLQLSLPNRTTDSENY